LQYGQRLAAALEGYVRTSETAELNLEEALSIARWRFSAEWKAVEGAPVWLSREGTPWGVLLAREEPGLSCGHRHVTLRSFPDQPDLGDLAGSVSTLGVWPGEAAGQLSTSAASRICVVGEMQFPHPTWQQDGFPALGRLVRFHDVP